MILLECSLHGLGDHLAGVLPIGVEVGVDRQLVEVIGHLGDRFVLGSGSRAAVGPRLLVPVLMHVEADALPARVVPDRGALERLHVLVAQVAQIGHERVLRLVVGRHLVAHRSLEIVEGADQQLARIVLIGGDPHLLARAHRRVDEPLVALQLVGEGGEAVLRLDLLEILFDLLRVFRVPFRAVVQLLERQHARVELLLMRLVELTYLGRSALLVELLAEHLLHLRGVLGLEIRGGRALRRLRRERLRLRGLRALGGEIGRDRARILRRRLLQRAFPFRSVLERLPRARARRPVLGHRVLDELVRVDVGGLEVEAGRLGMAEDVLHRRLHRELGAHIPHPLGKLPLVGPHRDPKRFDFRPRLKPELDLRAGSQRGDARDREVAVRVLDLGDDRHRAVDARRSHCLDSAGKRADDDVEAQTGTERDVRLGVGRDVELAGDREARLLALDRGELAARGDAAEPAGADARAHAAADADDRDQDRPERDVLLHLEQLAVGLLLVEDLDVVGLQLARDPRAGVLQHVDVHHAGQPVGEPRGHLAAAAHRHLALFVLRQEQLDPPGELVLGIAELRVAREPVLLVHDQEIPGEARDLLRRDGDLALALERAVLQSDAHPPLLEAGDLRQRDLGANIKDAFLVAELELARAEAEEADRDRALPGDCGVLVDDGSDRAALDRQRLRELVGGDGRLAGQTAPRVSQLALDGREARDREVERATAIDVVLHDRKTERAGAEALVLEGDVVALAAELAVLHADRDRAVGDLEAGHGWRKLRRRQR